MTKEEFETEYWVHSVWYNTPEVVAIFDDEDRAQEWAAENYDEVYGSMPVSIRGTNGSAYVSKVKRFRGGSGE